MGSRQSDHWMTLEQMEIRKYQDETGCGGQGCSADAFLTILTPSGGTTGADPPNILTQRRPTQPANQYATTPRGGRSLPVLMYLRVGQSFSFYSFP